MKLKRLLLVLVGFAVILAAAYALSIYKSPLKTGKPNDNAKRVSNNIKSACNILVMGDSLAKGTGDERGKGFAGYFADDLKSSNVKSVNVNNIASDGEVSSQLLKIVNNEDTAPLIKSSDMIFISIGGNDIVSLRNVPVSSIPYKIRDVEDAYLNNLKDIFKAIRSRNISCKIVFIGLYNPFGNLYGKYTVLFLNKWNSDTKKVVCSDSNSCYAATYDAFKGNISNYLSHDNFHPDSSGYKVIAKQIEHVLNINKK